MRATAVELLLTSAAMFSEKIAKAQSKLGPRDFWLMPRAAPTFLANRLAPK